MLYRLAGQTELYFEQASGSKKIYCNNTDFYFCCIDRKTNSFFSNTVNQCVRKPVREFLLSDGTNSTDKSVSFRITSAKQCAATSTVLPLYTQDRSQLDTKQCAAAPTVLQHLLCYCCTHRTGHN